MTSSQPQSAEERLGRLATPEHLLSVATQLADKWRKHLVEVATTPDSYERAKHVVMAAAYCQSLAILLDQPYNQVRKALADGPL